MAIQKTKESKTVWDYIKYLYKKYYDIPPQVVDLMAAEDVLRMCAEGFSNDRIASTFDLPIGYVVEIIQQYFTFGGWNLDLDINPFQVYTTIGKDFNMYVKTVSTVSAIMDIAEVKKSFNICTTLEKIRKEIKEKIK